MDSNANANWAVQAQPWNGSAGKILGGGGDPAAVDLGTGAARLDKIRMGAGQLPDAQYPDGYLGNYRSKQEGKLQQRMNDRSYQRGVHKFVKMTPDEYRWPSDFNPDAGIVNQARTAQAMGDGTIQTRRFGSTGDVTERYRGYMQGGPMVTDRDMADLYRKYGINGVTGQGTDSVDPARRAVVSKMAPGLSW